MKTISIINQKGGVGKTTTAAQLGAGFRAEGAAVLFIDLDPQSNLSYTMGVQNADKDIMQVLTGRQTAAASVIHTGAGDLIAASKNLLGADTQITEVGKEYKLKEALENLKDYDYIIIDTPPTAGILTVNALTASDTTVIPVQADIFSLQGLQQLYNTITIVRRYCNKDLKVSGLVLTRYNGRAVLSKDIAAALDQTAAQFETRLFNAKIRECTAIKEAQALRQNIFEYAPKSNGAADYKALLQELEGVL